MARLPPWLALVAVGGGTASFALSSPRRPAGPAELEAPANCTRVSNSKDDGP